MGNYSKSDKMMLCFFLLFSLSIDDKITEDSDDEILTDIKENSSTKMDDEKQLNKKKLEETEIFDEKIKENELIPDPKDKNNKESNPLSLKNENETDIEIEKDTKKPKEIKKEAPKLPEADENDEIVVESTTKDKELEKESEKQKEENENGNEKEKEKETDEIEKMDTKETNEINEKKEKQALIPDNSTGIDSTDREKEHTEVPKERIKIKPKEKPGLLKKNETKSKNDLDKEKNISKENKEEDVKSSTQEQSDHKTKPKQRITKKKPVNQNDEKRKEKNDDKQNNQNSFDLSKLSPKEQRRLLRDAERWKQFIEQYRYQQELEQMMNQEQDQYQIPIQLPKTFTDKRTGEVYQFPQSQEEFEMLPPRLQKAVANYMRKLKKRLIEYYQQYAQDGQMYDNQNQFYDDAQQQWPGYDDPQNYKIPFNDNEMNQPMDQKYNDKASDKQNIETDSQTQSESQKLTHRQNDKKSQPLLNRRFNPNTQDENPQLPPNTELDGMRRVTCISGFVGNNPIDAYGCWKCQDECHPFADCVYPGRCACTKGYSGDGVTACNAPTPYVLTANKQKSGVDVKFVGIEKDFRFHNAYCKYNNQVLPAISVNASSPSILCPFPPADNSIDSLSISLDKNSWSAPSPIRSGFLSLEERDIKNLFFYGGLILLILVCAKFITMLIGCGKKSAKDRIDDMLPLMGMQQGNGPITDFERSNSMA